MNKKLTSFLLALMLLGLTSCGSIPLDFNIGHHIAVSSGSIRLSEEELRLIALQYKTENESYYKPLLGIDFWQMEVTDDMTYEEYIREYYVFSECRALLCLLKEAEDQGITLSRTEEEAADTAAEAYYKDLTEDAISFTGAGLSDIRSLFSSYMLAGKTVEKLIEGKRLEVSDEESRVADFLLIRLDSKEKAQEIHDRVTAGESFRSVATENSLDEKIDYTASREELLPAVAEIVFSMSNGEISNIIAYNGSYFIIYLENSYDTLLSLNHKMNLLAERRFEGWEDVYSAFISKNELKRDNRMFEELSLSEDGDFPYVDMFSYFDE